MGKKPNPAKRNPPENEYGSDLEPLSDELDVSSPDVLVTDGDGVAVQAWGKRPRGTKEDEMEGDGFDENEGFGEDDEELEDDSEEENEDDDDDDEDEDDQELEEDKAQRSLSKIPFDTLLTAKTTMTTTENPDRQRKRKLAATNDGLKDVDLEDFRKQLQQLKRHKPHNSGSHSAGKKRSVSPSSGPNSDDSESHSDDAEEESHYDRFARPSKHAPQQLSAKRAVTRKRTVIAVPKNEARDPRFDPLTGPLDREKIRRNYAFLNQYRDTEISELKATLKAQKALQNPSVGKRVRKKVPKMSAEELDALKQELTRRESKKAAHEAEEREREVKREHKSRERDMVAQGKKPFHLKRSEVKKLVLEKKFEGLSGAKREKVMEKKRRRLTAKERKAMPEARRVAG